MREVVFFGRNSILIFENIPFIEEGWQGALSRNKRICRSVRLRPLKLVVQFGQDVYHNV